MTGRLWPHRPSVAESPQRLSKPQQRLSSLRSRVPPRDCRIYLDDSRPEPAREHRRPLSGDGFAHRVGAFPAGRGRPRWRGARRVLPGRLQREREGTHQADGRGPAHRVGRGARGRRGGCGRQRQSSGRADAGVRRAVPTTGRPGRWGAWRTSWARRGSRTCGRPSRTSSRRGTSCTTAHCPPRSRSGRWPWRPTTPWRRAVGGIILSTGPRARPIQRPLR